MSSPPRKGIDDGCGSRRNSGCRRPGEEWGEEAYRLFEQRFKREKNCAKVVEQIEQTVNEHS